MCLKNFCLVDLVTEELHCKAIYAINLKPDPMLLDTGDLSLISNSQQPWKLVCPPENRPFQIGYSTYIINKTEFCKFSFSAGLHYLVQTMLSCQNNATTTNGLFRGYCMFNKILFNYLKVYHPITLEPEMKQH